MLPTSKCSEQRAKWVELVKKNQNRFSSHLLWLLEGLERVHSRANVEGRPVWTASLPDLSALLRPRGGHDEAVRSVGPRSLGLEMLDNLTIGKIC